MAGSKGSARSKNGGLPPMAAEAWTSASDSRALTTLLLVRDVRRSMLESHATAAAAKLLQQPSPPNVTIDLAKGGLAGGEVRLVGVAGAPVGATPSTDFTLLGEILDSETKDLVAAAGVSDYIMSNRLMSKVRSNPAVKLRVRPLSMISA